MMSAPSGAGPAPSRILFVTLTNDLGSDRIVSELGHQGAACAVLGPARNFAALSRMVGARFDLPSRLGAWGSTVRLRRRLADAAKRWGADTVMPLDELSALVLRTIAADPGTMADLRDLLIRSLGRPEGYPACCQRVALMTAAARLGVRVPSFAAAQSSASGSPPFPLMVKRDHSSGSGGVAVARDGAALKRLLRRARIKNGIKRGLARLAGFRHKATPVLLQEVVAGDLAMRTVACRDGVVLDGISFLAVQVHPTKQASTMLRAIEQPDMEQAARRLVAALGCSGIVSFDFIVDGAGQAFLIEMNPRPIGSTHLGRLFGHDLGAAFLSNGKEAAAATLAPDTIVALFPKELERDPASPCLGRTNALFHDVPRDEPAVLKAYLGHLARLHPGAAETLRARLGVPVETGGAPAAWAGPMGLEA